MKIVDHSCVAITVVAETSCTFQCNDGYVPGNNGPASWDRTCTVDGTWSGYDYDCVGM